LSDIVVISTSDCFEVHIVDQRPNETSEHFHARLQKLRRSTGVPRIPGTSAEAAT
jgi:hypothetical protein